MEENQFYTSHVPMLYPTDVGETITERENFATYSMWLELVGEIATGEEEVTPVDDYTKLSYCLN